MSSMTFLEQQVREAIAILEGGTEYEKLHVPSILRDGLASLGTVGKREVLYDLIFPYKAPPFLKRHRPFENGDCVAQGLTRSEVEKCRTLAGHIPVYTGTVEVVTERWWLWPHEKSDPKSLGRQAIKYALEHQHKE